MGCTDADFTSYNDLANVNSGDCTNAPASADFTGDGQVQLRTCSTSSWPTARADEVEHRRVQDGCSVEAMGVADLGVSGVAYATATNRRNVVVRRRHMRVVGLHRRQALNYNSLATLDDASCSYHVCPDFNGDGQVQAEDLLDFLVAGDPSTSEEEVENQNLNEKAAHWVAFFMSKRFWTDNASS